MSDGIAGRLAEVDTLLRNAQLRDEIEPYLDEATWAIDTRSMPTDVENDFWESMLQWERAPTLPIAQWFDPPLNTPPLATLKDDQVGRRLYELLERLSQVGIAVQWADHLSDRELYALIVRDILPSHEKMIRSNSRTLVWRCVDPELDEETWLMYYADQSERDQWSNDTGRTPPEPRPAPYPRALPGASTT